MKHAIRLTQDACLRWPRTVRGDVLRASICMLLLAPFWPWHAVAGPIVVSGCSGGDFGGDCSLQELSRGGGENIRIGDKIFGGFSSIPGSTGGAEQPDRSKIKVEPLDGALEPGPGLRFVDMDDELSLDNGTEAQAKSKNLAIDFFVTVVNPFDDLFIKDNSLTMDQPDLQGFGSGVTIRETVFEIGAFGDRRIATKEVFHRLVQGTGLESDLEDIKEFAPVKQIRVHKELALVAAAFGSADINYFEQRFSQAHVPVSEPSGGLLLATGLMISVLIRRIKPARTRVGGSDLLGVFGEKQSIVV